jgi:predicted alpha/beta hydrolase
LHLRHITTTKGGGNGRQPKRAVFMLHGAVENGRIFYSPSNQGLGPFLARAGFDVFVGELRGRGRGRPHIKPGAAYGQTEAITEDVPAMLDFIASRTGTPPPLWVAHSWGGVILSSVMARFPERAASVAGAVYFGSKRSVRVWNPQRILYVDLIWKVLCRVLALHYGYLPARRLRMGSDDETVKSHRQSVEWVRPDPWVDSDDGFDYGEAIKAASSLPPIWYLAAQNDPCLGHPRDVDDFRREHEATNTRYTVLAKRNGNRRDYDHISMLTHPAAVADHFPQIAEWMHQASQKNA